MTTLSERSDNSQPGAAIVKRSIAIAGHRTSVSLEEAFWRELKMIAQQRGLSVGALVAAIDAKRKRANLSSAIRVFVLEDLAERTRGQCEPREAIQSSSERIARLPPR